MWKTESERPERSDRGFTALARVWGWMSRTLTVFGPLASALASPLSAQQTPRAQHPASRTVTGIVTEAATGAPLSAVQVAVRAVGDSAVGATSQTDSSGRFVVAGVGVGRVEIRFRRLGFVPATRIVTVSSDAGDPLELGTIVMTTTAVPLAGVDVVVEQPAVVRAADRDIYSAAAITSAAGGSATDLMRGIPDLEVDIDGGITLYGQAPAIYINGREAPMTGEALALFLEQFAAENVERVEVLPNPSARYDAEGAGGIINIVLKEDVGLGISGNAFVSAGTRGQLRGGSRATFERGALTLNGGASLGLTGDQRSSTELRQNLLADPITFLGQSGRSDRSSWSGNLDAGAVYRLGARTELDADVRLSRNVADAERVTRYTEMDADRTITDEYDLILLDDGSGTSMDLAVELEHRFGGSDGNARRRGRDPAQREHQLQVELEYERGGDLDRSLVERRILEELGEQEAAELTWQEDRETERELTLGVDYTRPLGKVTGLELGYEGELGRTDEGRVEEVRGAVPGEEPADRTSRGFLHRQTVHSAYASLTREFGDFGAQLGVRAERAANRLELPGDASVYENHHVSVFPNANLNYSFDEGKRIRLSYSMRVRRPTSNVLNPINTSNDPLERRVGNPGIEPQYTHSLMLNASWTGELGFLRATPFLRRSTNEWEQLRSVDADGLATTTYANLGSTDAYGVSLTASLREFHGIGARASLNGQRTVRDYSGVIDRATPSSTRWSVRTDLDGEISSALSAQGSLTYNPARDLPQGRASSTLMTRVGLRYRFLGRRASLSVNVTDPFDIYDSSIERSARDFVEIGRERVSMRRLTMSLSYSFQAGGGRRGGGDRRGGRGG